MSGAVTMAAAAAVTMVVSPWWTKAEGHTVPTRPTPSATKALTVPPLTKASLLRPEDLAQPAEGGAPYLDGETFGLADLDGLDDPEDVSGQKVPQDVCGDAEVLDVEAPETGWRQTYVSQGEAEVPAWMVSETVLQWPGRPDLATEVHDQLRAASVGCDANAPGEAPKRVTWSGEVNLPTLETAGTNSEGLTLASDVVVVGDAVVILNVGSAAGDLASRTSVNTFSWLFPAVTRLVGEVPEPGKEGPLHRLSGDGTSDLPSATGAVQ
ncbi:hypothetical protein [Kineosporia sp. NBRC 101731]|uniref:hypothetical protein n=1 Tax=Kineosporia sp. NBRC 101731 TaxID=3032199 RepID=UPI0025564424|nr:hypothetical protein [Kineosporia sp. NBRC 101731]